MPGANHREASLAPGLPVHPVSTLSAALALLEREVTAIAYETVEAADGSRLGLLTGGARNLPARQDSAGKRYRPSLPVDLHFLITTWALEAEKQNRRRNSITPILEHFKLLIGFLHNPKYNLLPVLRCVQHVVEPLRSKLLWGFDLPYMLTGFLNEHPRAAIKFQFRQLDSFVHPAHQKGSANKHIPRFISTRLSAGDFDRLLAEVRARGLVSACTPFDEESVDLIVRMGFQQGIEQDDRLRFAETGKISVGMPAAHPGIHLQDPFDEDPVFSHD